MSEQIHAAADYIRSKVDVTPEFALILGSGLGFFAEELEKAVSIPYEKIPHFPATTVEGHEGKMVIGSYENLPVMVLQGRFHYYEGYSMAQLAFPVRCMLLLGVSNLIVTNAAGSVDKGFVPGDLMLIRDHIKFHADSPLRGPNYNDFGPRFNDMSDPYAREIRTLARSCADKLNIPLKEGVYYYMTGPSFETASEIRAIHILGANAVGMSTVPEVIVAVHGGMKIMGLSCITNMGTGILDKTLGHEEVFETANKVKDKFMTLLKAILVEWAKG